MRTFFEFVENDTFIDRLAEYLVESGADVDALCQEILETAQCGALNEEILTEFIGQAINKGMQLGRGVVGGLARFGYDKAGSAMTGAAQYMGQSAQAEKLRQARVTLQGLQKTLASMGIPQEWLQHRLSPLLRIVGEIEKRNAAKPGYQPKFKPWQKPGTTSQNPSADPSTNPAADPTAANPTNPAADPWSFLRSRINTTA